MRCPYWLSPSPTLPPRDSSVCTSSSNYLPLWANPSGVRWRLILILRLPVSPHFPLFPSSLSGKRPGLDEPPLPRREPKTCFLLWHRPQLAVHRRNQAQNAHPLFRLHLHLGRALQAEINQQRIHLPLRAPELAHHDRRGAANGLDDLARQERQSFRRGRSAKVNAGRSKFAEDRCQRGHLPVHLA